MMNFFLQMNRGLPASELTIAEVLKEQNYHTATIGKWHLGHLPQYLPTRHGFDYYLKGRKVPDEMIYYHGTRLFAARMGAYKLPFYENNPLGYPEKAEKPEVQKLYNLQHDPSEKYDLAEKPPEIIKEIEEMVENHESTVVPVKSNLEKRIGAD